MIELSLFQHVFSAINRVIQTLKHSALAGGMFSVSLAAVADRLLLLRILGSLWI